MKKIVALVLSLLMLLSLAACGNSSSGTGGSSESDRTSHNVAESPSDSGQSAGSGDGSGENSQTSGDSANADAPVVYMTTDISPEGLMKVYEALGVKLTGDNIAVKLSTGEPPASNYLDPDLIRDVVEEVNGTIVECNTAYGGSRSETAMHYQVAEDHGFTDLGRGFVIVDEDGESMILPVEGGQQLSENYVGAHFGDFDGFLVLSHFKGHAMAGFGGAIKNISIGIGSKEGKCLIHTAGRSHTSP